jgi:hypothetical protein
MWLTPSAEESAVRAAATASWRSIAKAGRSKGEPDRGKASDVESRAHADLDTPEVFDVAGDRGTSRAERDISGQSVW